MLTPAGLEESLGPLRGSQVINLRIAGAVLGNEPPTSDEALTGKQESEDVREILVASTGRVGGDQSGSVMSRHSGVRLLFVLNMVYLMRPSGQSQSVVFLIA